MPLFVLLTIASGFVDLRVRTHAGIAVTEYVPSVVNGTAAPPARYRVLAPFIVQGIASGFHVGLESAWYASRLAWFLAAFVIFHAYLRTWFTTETAFGGTALLAAILPLTYTNSTMHPDHIPELALLSAGCLAAVRGRDGWFGATLLVAALNRETSAFLVVLYLLARPLTRQHVLRTCAFGFLWLVVFVGLRAWLGFAMYDYWQLWRNIAFLSQPLPDRDPYYATYAYFVVLLVVCLGSVAVAHWRHYPRSIRAGLGVVPVVLLVGFTVSSVVETRIFTPLLPLMLPAVVAAVSGAFRPSASDGVPGARSAP
jgi:hypothetical protein